MLSPCKHSLPGINSKEEKKTRALPWSLPGLKWVFLYPRNRAWMMWPGVGLDWGVARKTTMTFVYYHWEPGCEAASWGQSSEVYCWIELFLQQLQLPRRQLMVLNVACMPGAFVSSVHVVTHLILLRNWRGRSYYSLILQTRTERSSHLPQVPLAREVAEWAYEN